MTPPGRGSSRAPRRRGRLRVPVAVLTLLPVLASAGTLRVVVTNVTSDEGNVVVWVYAGPERWLDENADRVASLPVAGNRVDDTVTVEIELPAGEYALSVFQDLDGNGKLKRSFIGIPKEPAGLSNNAVPRFGPPKYKDARFTVGEEPAEQRIALD